MARPAVSIDQGFPLVGGRGGRSGRRLCLWLARPVIFLKIVEECFGLRLVDGQPIALHAIDDSRPLRTSRLLRGDEVGGVAT